MGGSFTYQVVGILLDGDAEQRVIATFDDLAEAEKCARFLRDGGKYLDVEVKTEFQDAGTATSDADVDGTSTQAGMAKPEDELGEVLFERRKTLFRRVFVSLVFCLSAFFFGVLGTVLGLLSLGIRAPQPGAAPPLWVPLILLGVAGMFAMAEWHYLRFSFRCHAFGVSRRGGFGTRRLRYEQIERIEYTASQLLLLHVIPFTRHLTIKFMPRPGEGLKRIVFHSNCFQDPDPEYLLREIAEIVEENSKERIALVQY